VQKKLGPAWSERGRPPAGYLTERLAEDWLRSTLDEARRGTLPGLVRTGVTFADAASEYLRYGEQDRGCKPSTLRDCRSNLEAHLLPAFGNQALEAVTPGSIDVWRASLRGLSSRTKNKLLLVMHGVFRRAQHV
jgi:integrase